MNNHSNHHLIKTILNLRTRAIESRSTKNWKKTDIEIFREKLMTRIEISITLSSIDDLYNNDAKRINRQMKDLTKTIQTIIEISISICKSNKYAKSEFTMKCKQISKNVKTTRRKWQQNDRSKHLWKQYKKIRNHLNHVIIKIMWWSKSWKINTEKRSKKNVTFPKTCGECANELETKHQERFVCRHYTIIYSCYQKSIRSKKLSYYWKSFFHRHQQSVWRIYKKSRTIRIWNWKKYNFTR